MRALRAASLGLALLACSESHSVIDADGTDGSPTDAHQDAALTLDAACSDMDGDGFAASACGGDDCDDTRGDIHPDAQRCVSPTRVERCEAGELVIEDCPAPTPNCDARTNLCAGAACGDAIVHPDEQCDDGAPSARDGCNFECRQVCYRQIACDPIGAACVPRPMGEPACSPRVPGGLSNGLVCTSADECESGWCDPRSHRCSWLCGASADYCGPLAEVWCGLATTAIDGFAPTEIRTRCEAECASQAECGAGAGCTLVRLTLADASRILVSACRASGSTADIGAVCGACASNNCIDGVCTNVCATDDDCAPPLPRCAEWVPPPGGSEIPRPAAWGTPWPLLCQP